MNLGVSRTCLDKKVCLGVRGQFSYKNTKTRGGFFKTLSEIFNRLKKRKKHIISHAVVVGIHNMFNNQTNKNWKFNKCIS